MRILNHLLYFSSSPAAVTILNHPYSNITRDISPKIHNTRLMKFLTISIKLAFHLLASLAHARPKPCTSVRFQKSHAVVAHTFHTLTSPAETLVGKIARLPIPKNPIRLNISILIDNFFMFCFCKK